MMHNACKHREPNRQTARRRRKRRVMFAVRKGILFSFLKVISMLYL